jgi:Ca2+-transporting ATPase
MGNATTVCSDKTGTLTQNKMTVVATTLGKALSFGGTEAPLEEDDTAAKPVEIDIPNVPVAEFVKDLSTTTKQLLVQSNSVNSTAFEGEAEGEKTFIGSKTEVALLTLCRDHLGSGPVQEERANANIVQVVPFDSAVKYMATVVKLPDGKFRAYVKGASEILLSKCNRVIAEPTGEELTTTEMTEADRAVFSQTITSYAGQTLRTIGSSYRDFESWPPPELANEEEITALEFDKVHKDMTLVAIFGIKDPLRPTVIDAIKDCRRAGVTVRMVTGDNILTGRAIAKECGIYHPEEGGIAMEGPAFRRKTEEELKELVPKLQVLARSSPEDKRILVRTLKELGETVAVTGDGTNDAPALKMADIGFAMGIAGTEVAKEAASIILLDDNFASIVKGISWGRAVNDSVKKFLQVCVFFFFSFLWGTPTNDITVPTYRQRHGRRSYLHLVSRQRRRGVGTQRRPASLGQPDHGHLRRACAGHGPARTLRSRPQARQEIGWADQHAHDEDDHWTSHRPARHHPGSQLCRRLAARLRRAQRQPGHS